MSAVTEPIRKLLKEEHELIWTHEQQQAFEKLKDIITKNPVLSFYDVSKPVTTAGQMRKNEVPKEVFEYWDFRDELSNVNGIILKGEKIIIPTSMRKNMLNKLRRTFGNRKNPKISKKLYILARINAQITDFISKCSVCLKAEDQTQKSQWQKVKLRTTVDDSWY
ncbi:unnamed protein product [Mytilus coruscus]|uniref:Integrase zinc-binding domain-containing protein n=1 Tax=Mytilus coruscus TaxID=42192 RepID=A0A6J8CYM5_MYTCO|nr:unnamed protein product [Mytilus coruscus]